MTTGISYSTGSAMRTTIAGNAVTKRADPREVEDEMCRVILGLKTACKRRGIDFDRVWHKATKALQAMEQSH